MRLFKIESQVGRKSILSNQSILPCSEESSFISTGVNHIEEMKQPQGPTDDMLQFAALSDANYRHKNPSNTAGR